MGIYTVATFFMCVNFNINGTILHKEFCDIAFQVRESFFSFPLASTNFPFYGTDVIDNHSPS